MKSTSELTDYYYKVLHGDLLVLEKERKKLKSKITTNMTGITMLALLMMYAIYDLSDHQIHDGIFIVPFVAFALGTFVYKRMIKDYVLNFKFRIIAPLIKAIDDNLNYNASSHLSSHLFERSGLFKHELDRYSGNDLVQGSIDTIPLQFSDVHAEYETKNSKGQSSWHTIFQGLFIVADFNKEFHGVTIVLPDSAQKSFGNLIGTWLQSKNSTHGELIKMDDPEFEKHFVVYGSDQIEARYLLTPTMMKRILDFKYRSKQDLYISFKERQIHMAIAYNKDLFEPTVFGSLLDYKQAMEYIKTLHLAIGIVEELKLNQKLWSKQ